MKKSWRPYAHHVLDAIEKIRFIQARGDLLPDEILCDVLFVICSLFRNPLSTQANNQPYPFIENTTGNP